MSFRTVDFTHLTKFNSAISSDFIDFYEDIVTQQIINKHNKPSSKTFAPSSIRCSRKSWFRLRGAQPDVLIQPDATLEFSAQIGTACHKRIQANLKQAMGSNWIAVKDFLSANPMPYDYELTEEPDGLETKVAIFDPPILFACDGIIRWKGDFYLLEIKTVDHSSFNNLTDIKPIHLDQIRCYATLLG